MIANKRRKWTVGLTAVGTALVLVMFSFRQRFYEVPLFHVGLPVTSINLSVRTPIIGITSWRICGPFVVEDHDQHYSPISEAEMFAKDYLEAADAREVPLKLPPKATHVQINFQRYGGHEPSAASSSGVFLNQTQKFPTPKVNSQLLFWGGYHVFKVLYAAAELVSSTDQDVVLLAATSSPVKIWLNDAVQTQSPPGSVGTNFYPATGVKAHLRAGRNTLLVKVICFPLRNDFGIWVATPEGAEQYVEEMGGVTDVLTQTLVPRGVPLRLSPIIDIYNAAPCCTGRYEIRDAAGRVALNGELSTAQREVNISSLPDGLYSISLEKGALASGEMFFVGDIKERLAMYRMKCASKATADLPCEALSNLVEKSQSDGAEFRLDKEMPILLLMAQFEWSLQGVPLNKVIPDHTPRVRLISFRSNIDGSIQHYYLHLPPDVQSGKPIPMLVVAPFNTSSAPYFDNEPTRNPVPLEKYSRLADQYHLSFIWPFGRGEQMPSELFERDVLEAMQDAKMRFRVDDSRVYLAGECLGGRNAFLLAEDYPEMFSALSTFEAFTGQSSAIMNKPSDSGNALIRLRNLSSMPIRLIHGEANFHSPSAQATILMQEAQKVGVFPEFVPLPGDGTFALISPHRKMFEFFATVRSRPPAAPHHVALATTELEHNHAFWIRVDRVRKTNAPAFLTADIEAQNQININSANVQGATINTLKLPPDLAGMKSWVVVCNGGQEQRLLPDSMGEIVLNISGDGQVTR